MYRFISSSCRFVGREEWLSRALSITRIEIKESVIYTAEGDGY